MFLYVCVLNLLQLDLTQIVESFDMSVRRDNLRTFESEPSVPSRNKLTVGVSLITTGRFYPTLCGTGHSILCERNR